MFPGIIGNIPNKTLKNKQKHFGRSKQNTSINDISD